MNKILIFSPYAVNPPHFETDLELAQRHLDDGDEVTLLGCSSGLPACDVNPKHRLDTCLKCVQRHRAGRRKLDPRPTWYSLQQFACASYPLPPKRFSTLEEVRRYSVDDFDAGYAALSSTISIVREPSPSLEGAHGDQLARFLQAAVFTYFAARRAIQHLKPDLCYVFNGRFSVCRAFFRASISEGVPCRIHERGATLNKFCIFHGHMPHDFVRVRDLVEDAWLDPSVPGDEKTHIGSLFFEERAEGVMQSWHSFVIDQVSGQLPQRWRHGKENIVVFNSSEDEFAAIGDNSGTKLFDSQMQGITQLADALSHNGAIHIWIRMHPNLRGIKNSQTHALQSISRPNLTILTPDDPVSSYALLRAATKVVTFGSTMGMEATFWGRPSVLLAPTFYSGLGGTWEPGTLQQAVQLLEDPALAPADRAAALKYGYYLRSRGEPFKYFKAAGIFKGQFKGERLSGGMLPRIIRAGITLGPLRPFERVLREVLRRRWERQSFQDG